MKTRPVRFAPCAPGARPTTSDARVRDRRSRRTGRPQYVWSRKRGDLHARDLLAPRDEARARAADDDGLVEAASLRSASALASSATCSTASTSRRGCSASAGSRRTTTSRTSSAPSATRCGPRATRRATWVVDVAPTASVRRRAAKLAELVAARAATAGAHPSRRSFDRRPRRAPRRVARRRASRATPDALGVAPAPRQRDDAQHAPPRDAARVLLRHRQRPAPALRAHRAHVHRALARAPAARRRERPRRRRRAARPRARPRPPRPRPRHREPAARPRRRAEPRGARVPRRHRRRPGRDGAAHARGDGALRRASRATAPASPTSAPPAWRRRPRR